MSVKDFLKRRLIRLHPMVVMGAVIGAVMFYFQGCSVWDVSAVSLSMLLTATLTGELSLVCDRCAKSFSKTKTVEYETLLAEKLENGESDDIILLDKDGQLELDELLGDVFILDLDTKNLCSEDCKGLCPGCGADLNVEPCRCKKEVDPRLAKLAQLLEQDN